jgi:CHAT domain-containing protein
LEDLALGYFERAERAPNGRTADYAVAVQTLSSILQTHPDDRVALFNRAIALERLLHLREAIADWERFLKLEPSGGWADEARERLSTARNRLQGRLKGIIPCPTVSASDVVSWGAGKRLEISILSVEGGWACLRERAIVKWLPEPVRFASALAATADAFQSASGDSWFHDVLRSAPAPGFPAAARALANAVSANLTVDAGRAEAAADEAHRRFKAMGNAPGAAQAAIEYDYAIRRAQLPAECLQHVAAIETSLAGKAWVWTALQARLEESTCLSMAGDQNSARRLAQEVAVKATGAIHAGLRLRALSYQTSAERLLTDYAAAWKDGVEGLREFWAGNEPPVWGYQLYYQLARAAVDSGQNQLALLSQREALAEVRMADRPSIEAFTWFDYGRIAMLAGRRDEARTGLSTAQRMFQALPHDRALEAAIADSTVYLAQVDLQDGDAPAALARLNGVAAVMGKGNSYPMELRYLRTMKDADLKLGKRAQYLADLAAIQRASEIVLASLHTFSDQLRWQREAASVYREAAESLAADPEASLNAWEAFRGTPFRGTAAPVDAGQAFRRLGIPQALVYAAMEDRLVIWRVTGGRVFERSVPIPRSQLAALAHRLYLLCSTRETTEAEWKPVARELSAYLIAPVEGDLNANLPVWVELDDALAPAPFSVLPLRSGEPVGVGLSVALFGGVVSLGNGPAPGKVNFALKMVAVGISAMPEGDARGLLPLPGAVDEATEAVGRFPAGLALLNSQATASEIERKLPGVAVFHFAGHARSTADSSELLVPGTPGQLSADRLTGLDLKRCRLAVISACGVESPELLGGSRLFGVATALLRAGVSGVLATRWDLDSNAARIFTRQFYDRVASGAAPVTATRAAAARMRITPGFSHPYYWAAYQFFGRG